MEFLVKPLIEKNELRSLVVGVITPDGKKHNFQYGVDSAKSVSDNAAGSAIFQIGSLSKLFVTAVLQILVDEGRMGYEDTVRSILPLEVQLGPGVGSLTISELVTHTSGLPRENSGLRQLGYLAIFLFSGRNPYGYLDKEDLYEFLRSSRISPARRGQYHYSNLGFALLAHLIELKTGHVFSELIQSKICGPLQMKDTVFELTPEQKRRLVPGHVGDQPKFIKRHTVMEPWDLGPLMRPVGGLYSSSNDLLTFASANLGQLNHPIEKCLKETQRVYTNTLGEGLALGWVINWFDNNRTILIYKHGMVSGYSAYIGMNQEKQIAVVALYSNFNWQDKIGQNLLLRLSGAAVMHE